MFPASALIQMRRLQELTMVDTCSIYRVTQVSDGAGGHTETRVVTEDGIKCRIANVSQRSALMMIANGIEISFDKLIYLPWDADVQIGDEIEAGSQTYEVLNVSDHTNQTALQTNCVRI